MQVNGPGPIQGPQSMPSTHRAHDAEPAATRRPHFLGADQLDISPEADRASRAHQVDFTSQIRDLPEIRADRVAEIRQAIQSGKYESPEKLDVTLERILDEFV